MGSNPILDTDGAGWRQCWEKINIEKNSLWNILWLKYDEDDHTEIFVLDTTATSVAVYNGDIGCDKNKDSKGIAATFVAVYNRDIGYDKDINNKGIESTFASVYNRDIVCDKDVNNKGVEATFASVYNGDIGY